MPLTRQYPDPRSMFDPYYLSEAEEKMLEAERDEALDDFRDMVRGDLKDADRDLTAQEKARVLRTIADEIDPPKTGA